MVVPYNKSMTKAPTSYPDAVTDLPSTTQALLVLIQKQYGDKGSLQEFYTNWMKDNNGSEAQAEGYAYDENYGLEDHLREDLET